MFAIRSRCSTLLHWKSSKDSVVACCFLTWKVLSSWFFWQFFCFQHYLSFIKAKCVLILSLIMFQFFFKLEPFEMLLGSNGTLHFLLADLLESLPQLVHLISGHLFNFGPYLLDCPLYSAYFPRSDCWYFFLFSWSSFFVFLGRLLPLKWSLPYFLIAALYFLHFRRLHVLHLADLPSFLCLSLWNSELSFSSPHVQHFFITSSLMAVVDWTIAIEMTTIMEYSLF